MPLAQRALEGRLRPIEDAMQDRPVAGLGVETLHRLEEVDVQAEQAIDPRELGVGAFAGETIMADQRAHDRPVLLHMRAIVLAIGAAPCEGQSGPVAVVQQRAIDELGAVVGIEPRSGMGGPSNSWMGALDAGEVLPPQRFELRPSWSASTAHSVRERSPRRSPAVARPDRLQEARLGVIPLGKRPNGDLVLSQVPGRVVRGRAAADGRAPGEQSLERGEAGLAEQRGGRRCDVHLAEGR